MSRRKPLSLVLSLCLLNHSAFAADILPFSTDGCSAFPDGHAEDDTLWRDCCIAHDLAYWAGGSYADRQAADEALALCVADVGEPEIAKLMLAGVRVGGSPFFPTSYRWGYGWPYVRGYVPLSETEKQQIMDAIDRATPDAFVPKTPTLYWQWVPWQTENE